MSKAVESCDLAAYDTFKAAQKEFIRVANEKIYQGACFVFDAANDYEIAGKVDEAAELRHFYSLLKDMSEKEID